MRVREKLTQFVKRFEAEATQRQEDGFIMRVTEDGFMPDFTPPRGIPAVKVEPVVVDPVHVEPIHVEELKDQ